MTELTTRRVTSAPLRGTFDFADRNFVWMLLLLLIIGGTIATPVFAPPATPPTSPPRSCRLGFVLAQSLVLITGHIDLSTEANMIIAAIVAGILLTPAQAGANLTVGGLGTPSPPVIPIMLALSTVIGTANGFMVAKLRMNRFMTTLGTLLALSGLTLFVGRGRHVINLPPDFRYIGPADRPHPGRGDRPPADLRGRRHDPQPDRAGGAPLRGRQPPDRGPGGRHHDQRVIIAAYAISGSLSGLPAFLLVGRLGTADAGISSGNLFISIASAVLGGVSLFGGRGTVTGMLGGLLLWARSATAAERPRSARGTENQDAARCRELGVATRADRNRNVHAKESQVNERVARVDAILETRDWTRVLERGWTSGPPATACR